MLGDDFEHDEEGGARAVVGDVQGWRKEGVGGEGVPVGFGDGLVSEIGQEEAGLGDVFGFEAAEVD